MAKPTILTVAVTGNITTPAQHAGLPVTPEQIAAACLQSEQEGAAIAHIHVRDPATGRPSMELSHYRDVVERLRAAKSQLIINLTTGPGGRFIPSDDDPKLAAPGTSLTTPEHRVEHIVALRPDICSLDLNTMYSGTSVVINTPRNVSRMAEMINAAGVKPELEVFDTGDIHLARDLIAKGTIKSPALFQIVLGVKYGASATPETLLYQRSLLPENCEWAAFGIGRSAFPMVAQAHLLGGHVRIGMEDTIYIDKGELTPDNAALVRKAVGIVRSLGGTIATAAEARNILGLGKASAARRTA